MKDKKTLITIIILLSITLPLSIYGAYKHFTYQEVIIDDNPNHDYILNNKVYFYQGSSLKSTYACSDTCEKVSMTNEDAEYHINSYNLGTLDAPTVLNDSYALFKEGRSIILYGIDTNLKALQFDTIKNYQVEHSSPVLIAKSNSKYEVIDLTNMFPIITQYDFIAIPNRVHNNVLDTSRFIAMNASHWYILDWRGEVLLSLEEPIVDFNDTYVVVLNNLYGYKIYNLDNTNLNNENIEYLKDVSKKDVRCIGNYILVIDDANTLNIYENLNEASISSMELPTYSELDLDYNDNSILLYLDHNLYQSIALE